jgi:hypothetical protein
LHAGEDLFDRDDQRRGADDPPLAVDQVVSLPSAWVLSRVCAFASSASAFLNLFALIWDLNSAMAGSMSRWAYQTSRNGWPAKASVLEPYVRRSRYRQHGERVVQGQLMMQAASDIYLGWTKGLDVRRHFYWRQLRDMKGSALPEAMPPVALTFYAGICGWTLARAHARSGDPIAIAAYLGDGDAFDKSITDFSERYADQNERDYQAFVNAIRSGRLEAVEGV